MTQPSSDAAAPRNRAQDRVAVGEAYARSRLYDRATVAFTRAAGIDPGWVVPMQRLGRAHHVQGHLQEALECYQRALEIQPTAEVARQMAEVALDARDMEAAEEHLTRALELSPHDGAARHIRGQVRLRSGNASAALEDFQELLQRSALETVPAPSPTVVLLDVAAAWAALGELDRADDALSKCAALRPDDPALHLARARIFSEHAGSGSRGESRVMESLDEALRLDPDFLPARRMRAWRLARRRSVSSRHRAILIQDLRYIAQRGSADSGIGAMALSRSELAGTYFALGSLYDDDPEQATAALDAYACGEALDATRPQPANNIGVIHFRRGDERSAIAWLCEAIARDPDYDRAYHNLAQVIHTSDDPERAWKEILDNFPDGRPAAADVVGRVSAALVEVGRAEVYEGLYTGGHRLKNLLGVLGDRLRRLAAKDAPPPQRLQAAAKASSDLYDEWVGYLDRIKTESLALDTIDAAELVRSVIRTASRPGREVELALPRGESPVLLGDRVKLADALLNVVNNALEAGGNATVTLSIPRATEGRVAGASRLRIEVADTGPGIPDEVRKRIFTPGFTTKDKGSGFGLTIAARVVYLHQGKISVDSTEGAGTTVVIDLPIDLAAVAPSRRARSAGLRSLAFEGVGGTGTLAPEDWIR